MKNLTKLIGVAALVMAAGFTMAACDNGTSGNPASGAPPTPILAYEPIGNPISAYRVSKGTVTEDDVVIDATYGGLPVTEIGSLSDSVVNGAFSKTRIDKINIPDSVTTIGACAFNRCVLLEEITIPSSVTTIGNRAFSGCAMLTSVTIPADVSIGNFAFPEGSNGSGSNSLRTAYLAAGPGTYTREPNGSTWTKL